MKEEAMLLEKPTRLDKKASNNKSIDLGADRPRFANENGIL